MERYGLPAAFLAMHAGWLGAFGMVAGARLTSTDSRAADWPLAALATLCTAYGAVTALRRFGDRIVPPMSLMFGAGWTLFAVWTARHFGEPAAWLGALPVALTGTRPDALVDVIALALTFFAWWRGQRAALAPPEHDSTVRAFGTGGLALGAALLLGAGRPALAPSLTVCVLLFLSGGLPALSLARLKEVRRDLSAGAARGDPARLDGAWSRTLLIPVVAVLAAGVGAATVVGDAGARGAVLAALGMAGELLLAALYWPILLVGFLAEWLVFALRGLRRPPGGESAEPPALRNDAEDLFTRLGGASTATAPWLAAVPWVLLALGAALAALGFLATSRPASVPARDPATPLPEREALSVWGSLLADVRLALARLFRRLSGTSSATLSLLRPRGLALARRRASVTKDPADPRAAYRQLLEIGRREAVARRPDHTPDEYLALWRETLAGEAEARVLTDAYRDARYGPPAPRGAAAPPPVALAALLARIREAIDRARRSSGGAPRS